MSFYEAKHSLESVSINQKKLNMKKTDLLTLALIGCIGFWSSCSEDHHDHADECDYCHIAIENAAGTADSIVWHIEDGSGDEILFCGEDLHATEASYTIPAGQDLISETGGDTLFGGTVITHLVDGYEIHCHESK